MKTFVLGFVACWVLYRYNPQITKYLEDQIAKLQLQGDMIRHDHLRDT